jgi:hypothetical protein
LRKRGVLHRRGMEPLFIHISQLLFDGRLAHVLCFIGSHSARAIAKEKQQQPNG